MAANIIIGIGGTGAKVVEATLHAAVAGLAGASLRVGLVDQDGSNGNVARTCQLLDDIIEPRILWRTTGASHGLGGSRLFSTDLQALADPPVWTPHPDKATNLARIFDRESMSAEERLLFDGLFAVGNGLADTEQNLPLDKGYRGRPHVGSAAMTSRADDDIDFWNKLMTALDAAKGATEVRILLAGSVFGGTGAAGFPTLARLIRRRLPRDASNVHIGGVLMLPYFDFDPPDRDDTDDPLKANVVRSEELVLQSKSALKHYHELLRQEDIFDQLYLVGWDRPFDLGYHSEGDNDQANPPLLPELLGALAACRFFAADLEADGDRVLVCARNDCRSFSWADLPSPTSDRDAPVKALGQLLRFCVAWKHWGPLVSRPRSGFLKELRTHPWYRRQQVDSIKYNQTPVEAEVKALDAYCDLLIGWAGSIEKHARSAGLDFRLWRTDHFVRPGEKSHHPVRIPETLGENEHDRAFSSVLMTDVQNEAPPTSAALMDRLTNESEADHGQRGLGVFVSALHAFSTVQPPPSAKA